MTNDFIPTRDGDLDAYEDNFNTKLALHAPTLGLDPAVVTNSTNIIVSHRDAYTSMNGKRAASKSASEENRTKKRISIKELRRMSKIVKASNTYTTSIGEDLQIIGPKVPGQTYADLKPVLKLTVNGQDVILQFKKNGAHGIKIYSKRGSETEFKYLSLDTASPYKDNRAKLEPGRPEQREYYANYFVDDTDVGESSDTVKVIVP